MKKDRTVLVLTAILIIIIILNVCMFRDYKYTKSNHNAATWMIFRLVGENMRKMNSLNEVKSEKELKIFQEYTEEISYSITLLELNIRDSDFTSDSINKREFESLINKLRRIFGRLEYVEGENIDHIKNCIIRISKILTDTKGGFKEEGILDIMKTGIIIDSASWRQLESEISRLESLLN